MALDISWFKKILINAILPTLETVGESYLEELLGKLKDEDTENFALDLQGISKIFSRLKVFSLQTSSNIDDGVIDMILEAVNKVAEANGISLAKPSK